jgi:hypothetical protein
MLSAPSGEDSSSYRSASPSYIHKNAHISTGGGYKSFPQPLNFPWCCGLQPGKRNCSYLAAEDAELTRCHCHTNLLDNIEAQARSKQILQVQHAFNNMYAFHNYYKIITPIQLNISRYTHNLQASNLRATCRT